METVSIDTSSLIALNWKSREKSYILYVVILIGYYNVYGC